MSSTVDELLDGLKHDCALASLDSALRKAQALARMASHEVVERLMAEVYALDDLDLSDDAGDMSDELFRLGQALSTALGTIQPPPLDELLGVAADETRLRARCCAIRALGLGRCVQAVPLLLRILDNREIEEIAPTMNVIESLGLIGDRRAVSRLIALLEPPDELNGGWLIHLSARSLGMIGDPRAIAPLVGIRRHHPESFARQGAVEGLRIMRQVGPVREALDDAHPLVRIAAQKALGMAVETDLEGNGASDS